MDYPRRAGLLADEIQAKRPELVGLQEAVTFHIQSPGDAALGGNTPATTLVYDYAQILLDSLTARGLRYRIVARTVSTQVEVPIYTGNAPIPFDDLRFTDTEVILAAEDVEVSNAGGAPFSARISLPLGGPGGPQLEIKRSWASVDVAHRGETFRVVSTHLEVQRFAPVQIAQAGEIIAIANASPHPVILMGDFNSDADGSQTPSYGMIAGAGYFDVWGPQPGGDTCCHENDLSNERADFDQRLDVVFTRGFAEVGANAVVLGNHPGDRRGTGLWPSDHAGVFARVLLF
jgi:endonuclease/exonuclease/phosphatase family metal-dependent hydrolase